MQGLFFITICPKYLIIKFGFFAERRRCELVRLKSDQSFVAPDIINGKSAFA
jgi:hypothetical protein